MTTLVPGPDGDARVIAEMPDLEHTPAMDSREAWVSDIACVRYYCGGILSGGDSDSEGSGCNLHFGAPSGIDVAHRISDQNGGAAGTVHR